MAGPHSGWPYATSDPNPTEEDMYRQAGELLAKLKTMSVSQAAREMGVCRVTVYRRLELISKQIPPVDVVRLIHFERLESMFEGLQDRLDGEVSNADYGRLTAEQRQVLARQSALLRAEAVEAPDEPEPADEQPDPWVDGAKAEAQAELDEVAERLRNGQAP